MAKKKPLTIESAREYERDRWLTYAETGRYDQSGWKWCELYGDGYPGCDDRCPMKGSGLWERWLVAEPKMKREIAREIADRGL